MIEAYKAVVKKDGQTIRSWSGQKEDVVPEFIVALREEREHEVQLWCNDVCVHSARPGRMSKEET